MNKGDRVGGFEVLSVQDVPELRAKGIYLRHVKTGCEVFHLLNDDEENLFAFAFRTSPYDSSGVAHILEHSVLCGSRGYPLKDAFLTLMKGSLATFLNAFTFPDKTVYPASSTVEADYFNLMGVYGDAVFFPLLSDEIFMQEGHRYDLAADGSLSVEGVVYNEMKGSYSSPDSVVQDWAYRSLFRNSPYSFDSGGDPRIIPDLTLQGLKDFHHSYYSPSNCRIFLCGNLATEKQLAFLESRFLNEFPRVEVHSEIPPAERFSSPERREVPYPASADAEASDRSSILVSWLTASSLEPVDALSLEVLNEILVGHDGSPLAKALVESGLGEDLSPASGLETELRELIFAVGLRNADVENSSAVEKLILDTLRDLVEKGIPADLKDAGLRTVDFSEREIRRGGGPYSLSLMRRCLRGWLHGAHPLTTLAYSDRMEEVKRRSAADPGYFESLIRKWLLDNPHRVTLVVRPDPGMKAREEAELSEKLSSVRASLSPADVEALAAETARLKAFQTEEDDPAIVARIPFLHRSDLPRVVESIPSEVGKAGKATLYSRDVFTNGIVYVDLAFSLEGLDRAYYPYLPLFCRATNGMGIPGKRYDEVSTELSLKTGGFYVSLESSSTVSGITRDYLLLRIKAFPELLGPALALISDIVRKTEYGDERRLKDLLSEQRNELVSALVPSGSSFASLRSSAGFSAASATEESWRGISQAYFLEELKGTEDFQTLAKAFERIRDSVFTESALIANLTAESRHLGACLGPLDAFASSCARSPEGPARVAPIPGLILSPVQPGKARNEAFSGVTTVGFAASTIKASPFGTREQTREGIVAHLLSTGFLWEKARMKNGAYGAFAGVDSLESVFSFATYRDPKAVESFALFPEALSSLAAEGVEDAVLENAVVSVVGKDIRPFSPGEKGFIAFKRILNGITAETRQARRDELLAATPEAVRESASSLRSRFESAVSVLVDSPGNAGTFAASRPDCVSRELPS
jgi:presequence protease